MNSATWRRRPQGLVSFVGATGNPSAVRLSKGARGRSRVTRGSVCYKPPSQLSWQVQGVPLHPEAWLVTAARRLIDQQRHRRVKNDATSSLRLAAEEAEQLANEPFPFPDDRLKLLFVCAHPAIDPACRTPLMLQTVLGLDAARIRPGKSARSLDAG